MLLNTSQCLVIAGEQQTPAVHALCHAINNRLGNTNKTIEYIPPPDANPVTQISSLTKLSEDLAHDQVEVLLIVGANPAYATPASFDFAKLLTKAKLTIHVGLFEDETARLCRWHLPQTHFLESFGDARAFDGTISLQQPLIAPLYDSRSASELLALLRGEKTSSYQLLKNYWADKFIR